MIGCKSWSFFHFQKSILISCFARVLFPLSLSFFNIRKEEAPSYRPPWLLELQQWAFRDRTQFFHSAKQCHLLALQNTAERTHTTFGFQLTIINVALGLFGMLWLSSLSMRPNRPIINTIRTTLLNQHDITCHGPYLLKRVFVSFCSTNEMKGCVSFMSTLSVTINIVFPL